MLWGHYNEGRFRKGLLEKVKSVLRLEDKEKRAKGLGGERVPVWGEMRGEASRVECGVV